MRTNLSLFINNNSLYLNINLHTDLSIDIDLNMCIKINIIPINTNLYKITTSVLCPRLDIIANKFLST